MIDYIENPKDSLKKKKKKNTRTEFRKFAEYK